MAVYPSPQSYLTSLGGSGLSFGNVPLVPVDPTTWATNDPNGILNSVSYAGGVTSFTMNASAGSLTYRLSDPTQEYPRLSTLLRADNGDGTFTTCTTDDYFIVYFRLRQFSSPGFDARPFIAICADPTSTAASTIQPFGGFCYQPGNIGGGLWSLTSTEQNGNAAFDALHGVAIFAPQRGIQINTFGTDASGIRIPTIHQDRFINQIYAPGQDLKVMVGVATASGTTAIGGGDVVQLAYEMQAFRLTP